MDTGKILTELERERRKLLFLKLLRNGLGDKDRMFRYDTAKSLIPMAEALPDEFLELYRTNGAGNNDFVSKYCTFPALASLAQIMPEKAIELCKTEIQRKGNGKAIPLEQMVMLARNAPQLSLEIYEPEFRQPDNDITKKAIMDVLSYYAETLPDKACELFESCMHDCQANKIEAMRHLHNLVRTRTTYSVNLIERLLEDENNEIRECAVRPMQTLSKVMPAEFLRLADYALERLAGGEQARVACCIENFVEQMPHECLRIYDKVLDGNYSEMVQEYVAETLGKLAYSMPDQALARFEKGLEHEKQGVRKRVSASLGAIAPISPKDYIRLFKLAMDDDVQVRRKTVSTLGAIAPFYPEIYRHHLKQSMRSSDLQVRAAAYSTLGSLARINMGEFVRFYEKGLRSTSSDVVDETAKSLTGLAEVNPQLYKELYIKSINARDLAICNYTSRTLPAVAEVSMDIYLELIYETIKAGHIDACTTTFCDMAKRKNIPAHKLTDIYLALMNRFTRGDQFEGVLGLDSCFNFAELAQTSPTEYIEVYNKGINHPDKSLRHAIGRSLGVLAKTTSDTQIMPILDEEHHFLEDFLNSRYIHTFPSEDEMKDRLINLVQSGSTDTDYRTMRRILRESKAENLDEIIECANVCVDKFLAVKREGVGTHKKVYLCTHAEIDNLYYALVVTDLKNIVASTEKSLRELGRTPLENCRGEANKLAKFTLLNNNHLPRIVHQPTEDKDRGIYYWVEEYVPTNLFQIADRGWVEEELLILANHIFSGLDDASRIKYCHGDINLSNIGISGGMSKILDWGVCSTVVSDPDELEGRSFYGYRLARAPEIFEGGVPDGKSDVWSVGVVLYRLLTGYYPFKHTAPDAQSRWHDLSLQDKEIYETDIRRKLELHRSNPEMLFSELRRLPESRLADIIQKCLEPDPSKRPAPYVLLESLHGYDGLLIV